MENASKRKLKTAFGGTFSSIAKVRLSLKIGMTSLINGAVLLSYRPNLLTSLIRPTIPGFEEGEIAETSA